MEIIKIPVEFKKAEPVPTDQRKLLVSGPLRFSCDCGHTSELNLDGIIFRYMDFYCPKCGTHFKVTNPAFVPPVTKKKR